MQLEDIVGAHGMWVTIINVVGFLMVYIGLKVAFVYGRSADFGQASYGRDANDRPLADNGWIEEILQFVGIQMFWVIILFVHLSHWLYGWRIIFRTWGWVKHPTPRT